MCVHPIPSGASKFTTNGTERKLFIPEYGCRPEEHNREFIQGSAVKNNTNFLSMPLMYAEKTRGFVFAQPATSKTLFGC